MAADITPQDSYLDPDGSRIHYLDWGHEPAPPMLLRSEAFRTACTLGNTTKPCAISGARVRSPPLPMVRRLKVPTLIVRGSESDIFTLDTATRVRDLISGSQFVEIQGAGHSIPADAPEAFERAVREFLVL